MKQLTGWAVAFFWLLAASAAHTDDFQDGLTDDLKPTQIYKSLLPSVMTLTVQNKDGTTVRGTGFLAVRDGLAVTAWHVIKDARSATAKFSDGREFEVSGLVDGNEKQDVALVRVMEQGRPLLPLATVAPEVGVRTYAVGAPEGLEFSLSDGLISQVRDISGMTQLQFTCAVSPGNSGGPLVNAHGQVVGVVSWRLREGQSLNFAALSSYVLTLDGSLSARPWGNPDVIGTAAPVADADMDSLLADAINALADAATTIRLVDEEIVLTPGGYAARVPPCLYDGINRIANCALGVASAHSTDPVRETARVALKSRLCAALKALTLEGQEIDAAKKQSDWGGRAGELYAQSLSPYQAFTADYSEEVKNLASSPLCLNALLTTGPFGNQAIGSERFFRLRAFTWVHSPLTLAVVPKDGLAYRLGLRAGDTLVSSGGPSPISLCSLKADLLTNAGRRIRLVVLRGGRRREWNVNIPRKLSE